MGTGVDSSFCSLADGPAGTFEIVAAVDSRQSLVMAGFDAVFNHNHRRGEDGPVLEAAPPSRKYGPPGEVCQEIELGVIDAVGPRSDHDSHHGRVPKHGAIQSAKCLQISVSI